MTQEPLTPANTDLRDFPSLMLDVQRLRDSDLSLMSTGDEFKAAVLLWAASWHQLPAASLPDDERLLAGLTRLSTTAWRKVRAIALRGWIACTDGRLYHPVIAEKALECWLEKLRARISSGYGNAKRYGGTFDRGPLDSEIEATCALLAKLNPKSRALAKAHRATQVTTSEQAPGGTPGGNPAGSQLKGTEGNTLPERAPSAPQDRNKEAWRRGVELLSTAGRMAEPKARQFFGKLLRDSQLEGCDLLASIVAAEGTGTADPQGYLTAAARQIRDRKVGQTKPQATVDTWGDDEWRRAYRLFRAEGVWGDNMGPRPGEPNCRVPAHVLVEAVA